MDIYVVRTGDNVDQIAYRFGVSAESVIFNNQLEYPYSLAVGQALLVGETPKPRKVPANGYAYPFINRDILEQTLPFLEELLIFSYGFTLEGDLVYPQMDETWMIEAARRQNTSPVLTLTPLGADGRFNNQLISQLVRDPGVQQRLMWQLGQRMLDMGYEGVDVDFEYILPEDRVLFAEFVGRLRTIMNQFGYTVSVALAPKTSRDQAGLLYEGVDYKLLGAAADYVMLMTYEWGYTYGPPMAVAPLNMVRRVVDYAVTEIPPDKINLGIPNYGYDWPLPYERGVTKARSLGNMEAIQLAIDHGVDIRFDQIAMSPYFRYWQYGVQHEVWFEDVRSIRGKLELVREYGLRGCGYWQLMRLFRANWLLLEDFFRPGGDVVF